MNFADDLKELSDKTAYESEQEKQLRLERSAERYAQETATVIREASLKLAKNGQRRLTGYLSKKWLGSRYSSAISDYPEGEVYYRPDNSGEYFTMESFGESPAYAEAVSEKISQTLGSLGFESFTVRPEIRKFIKRQKYRRFLSRKSRYKVVGEKEKYVIYLEITW